MVEQRKDMDPRLGRVDELGETTVPDSLADLLRHHAATSDVGAEAGNRQETALDDRDLFPESGCPAPEAQDFAAYRRDDGMHATFSAGPGSDLRKVRETHGMDLASLAYRTRLSVATIEAMEQNRFQHLPPAYIRGYLRAIAREFDVDPEAWIRSYEAVGIAEPVLRATVQKDLGKTIYSGYPRSRVVVASVVAFIVFVVVGAYLWTTDRESHEAGDGKRWWVAIGELWQTSPPDTQVDSYGDSHGGFTGTLDAQTPLPSIVQRVDSSRLAPELEEIALDHAAVVTEAASEAVAANQGVDPPIGDLSSTDSPVPEAVNASSRESGSAEASSHAANGNGAGVVPARNTPAEAGGQVMPPATTGPVAQLPRQDAAPLLPGQSIVRLDFVDTSWVEVRSASNRVEVVGIFHNGDSQTLRMELPGRVVLGNANGVRLFRDGDELDLQAFVRGDRTARFNLERP